MIRPTPLPQILRHNTRRPFINRDVIAPDAIHLFPPFSASGLQCEFDVGEGLGYFGVEVRGDGDGGCVWVPAALEWVVRMGMDGWMDGKRLLDGMEWKMANLGRRF
jgi:hypothetical protein